MKEKLLNIFAGTIATILFIVWQLLPIVCGAICCWLLFCLVHFLLGYGNFDYHTIYVLLKFDSALSYFVILGILVLTYPFIATFYLIKSEIEREKFRL